MWGLQVMRTVPFLGMTRGVVQKVGLSKESVKCFMCTPTFCVAHQAYVFSFDHSTLTPIMVVRPWLTSMHSWVDDLTVLTELEGKGDEAAIKAVRRPRSNRSTGDRLL